MTSHGHTPVSPSTPLLRRGSSGGRGISLPNSNWLWKAGALTAAVGIITGAFGVHALKKTITEMEAMHAWETASHYAFMNGIALLALSLHPRFSMHRFAGPAICLGSLIFSGSIWALTLDRDRRYVRLDVFEGSGNIPIEPARSR